MADYHEWLTQSRTQNNACSRVRLALALGKRNEICNLIGLAEISQTDNGNAGYLRELRVDNPNTK